MTGPLDFSGAPALIIPVELASAWRGIVDPATGLDSTPDFVNPRTDYDRVCAVMGSAACIPVLLGEATCLALSLETDNVTWDPARWIVANSTELPSLATVQRAMWTELGRWKSEHTEYLLLNAAADGTRLGPGDSMPVRLPARELIVEWTSIQEDDFWATCHRFRITQS